MSASNKSLPTVGFLTVCEHAELGLFGGLLLLNVSARPLEFHCTAPVKPTRAQAILYGPTLKPFLYGEQIGQTLIGKTKLQPLFVCTDVEPILAAREFSPFPLVWVREKSAAAADSFPLGKSFGSVHARFPEDQPTVCERWQPHVKEFDLLEPFVRIREAIEEAQKSARVVPPTPAAA